MEARERAMQIASRIARDTEREFKHARVEVEPADRNPDDEVDAYLWLESDAGGEDVEDLWAWVRFACTQAWENEDVRIVWRWKRNRAGTLEDDDES
jgi:hypothetical protein